MAGQTADVDSERFVVISGCSGGGKSTLLDALSLRGFHVVPEPGRRIVKAEIASGSTALLPWVDTVAFARRAIEVSLDDRLDAGGRSGWVFFDRGLVDAAASLHSLTGESALDMRDAANRFHRRVFLAPPWPDLFSRDEERRHGYNAAVSEFETLSRVYPSLGYETHLLPKASVADRIDFVLDVLAQPAA